MGCKLSSSTSEYVRVLFKTLKLSAMSGAVEWHLEMLDEQVIDWHKWQSLKRNRIIKCMRKRKQNLEKVRGENISTFLRR